MAAGLGEDRDRCASCLLSQALCPSQRSAANRSVDHPPLHLSSIGFSGHAATFSVAALIVGSFHARLSGRAFVYTLSILCLRFSALARLSRSHAVLIPLGRPGGTCIPVIPAGLLSVIANGTASRGGRALRECVCGKYDACQQRKNSHGDLRVSWARRRC